MGKVNKKQRNLIIVVVIVLAIILFVKTRPLSFVVEEGVPVFPDNKDSLFHYTNSPQLTPDCVVAPKITSEDISFGNEATLKTKQSNFKFVSQAKQYISPTTGSPTSTVIYDMKVYKDGILIDTLDYISGCQKGTDYVNPTTNQILYRAYGDDGTVYSNQETLSQRCYEASQKVNLPDGETGVEVSYGVGLNHAHNQNIPSCSVIYTIHQYRIVETGEISTVGFNNLNGWGIYNDNIPLRNVDQHTRIILGTSCPSTGIWIYEGTEDIQVADCTIWLNVPECDKWYVYRYQEPSTSNLEMTEEQYKSLVPTSCYTQECQIDEIKYHTCPDGSQVYWCSCEDNKWVCIMSPETQCKKSSNVIPILAIIGALLFVGGLGYLYYKTRK